jgi:hypothetical protein
VAIDSRLSISSIDVNPEEEGLVEYGLHLRGVVHDQDDIGRIEEMAKALAGGVPVKFDLHYRMYPRQGPWEYK